jgi:chemotaxis protein CheD
MEVAQNVKVNDIHVGIGEYKIAGKNHRLVTLGLGSCVGVSLWDPLVKIGGLLHIMLPNSKDFTKISKPEKYADLGIPLVVRDLLRHGAVQSRILAKLVGGAQMFTGAGANQLFNIGERNIQMSRQILKDMSIKIAGEDVGGNKGRTMYLDIDTGEVMIRTIGQSIKVI